MPAHDQNGRRKTVQTRAVVWPRRWQELLKQYCHRRVAVSRGDFMDEPRPWTCDTIETAEGHHGPGRAAHRRRGVGFSSARSKSGRSYVSLVQISPCRAARRWDPLGVPLRCSSVLSGAQRGPRSPIGEQLRRCRAALGSVASSRRSRSATRFQTQATRGCNETRTSFSRGHRDRRRLSMLAPRSCDEVGRAVLSETKFYAESVRVLRTSLLARATHASMGLK